MAKVNRPAKPGPDELGQLRSQLEAYLDEISRSYYQYGAGLSERFSLRPLANKYASLFTPQTIRGLIERLQNGLPTPHSFFLAQLTDALLDGYIASRLAEPIELLSHTVATMKVELGSRRVSWLSLPALIAGEPVREKRLSLSEKELSGHARLSPPRRRLWLDERRLLAELGIPSVVSRSELLTPLREEEIRRLALKIINQTEQAQREDLYRIADWLGVESSKLHHSDFQYLARLRRLDGLFPASRMESLLRESLSRLGIDLDRLSNLSIDFADRPSKSPRAFCVALSVPGDVRAILRPMGGYQDLSTLFHELGHLLYYGHMSPDLPLEARRLGDSALHELYAFLLQYITTRPAWLTSVAGLEGEAVEGLIPRLRFIKRTMVRRYAAKVIYELEFHRDPELGEELAERYCRLLTSTTGFYHDPRRYLADLDQNLYSAHYLRAWVGEAQLSQFLSRELGEEWFLNPRAGKLLTSWWRRGQDRTLDQFLTELGFKGIDPAPLIEELTA